MNQNVIEPIQVILTKINGKYFTTADMNSAYNQMPLDEQSRRLTQFVIGNQQYEFNRLFYGISIGPAAFSAFMSKIFRPLILKKNAITYLDDVFMQSQTKDEMFNVLEKYHQILQNENLKAAPDKSHFFLTRVKFLGHNIERKTITPLKSRIDAIQKLQPPTNKKKIQEFLGMLNFLSKYVYKMQLYLRPFYNILRQQNNFEWNIEHQTRFEEIKKLLTEQISNTIPDSNQPFYAMCDASNFGIGAALLQSHNGTNKMNLISANSRLFTQAELRLSTLMRECTAIIYTLTEYEFLILGSKHPTVLFTDHKPIIFLFTQKSNPNHRVYRFQLILMKFPNLHIVWTAGKNLALPDTLSQNTPPELLTRKTVCSSPQAIETTDVIATLYSKARATTVTGYKFTATFSEKKVHCSQVSNGNKNRLDHESFYQSNIERLLHLNPDDCKNELLRLNITQNKNSQRKLVNFQVFPDSVHQSQLERHQGHIKLDEKYPYNGAHGRLTYDLHDKHWIPHIGINDPSNCKADTKNKGYQEIMFFDWKIQLEKIQLTRDLSDNTMIYQGIRLPCKNDQGYCDTNETRNFVDEYVLMPTLSWTSYYHFTNPLCLPLSTLTSI